MAGLLRAIGILAGVFQVSEATGVGSVLRTHSQVLWLVHEVVVSWATCVSVKDQCCKGPRADPNHITLHHTIDEIFYRSVHCLILQRASLTTSVVP